MRTADLQQAHSEGLEDPPAENKKRREIAPPPDMPPPDIRPECSHIPISNTFGNCASGSAVAPTAVATIAIRIRLMQRLPRIWPAIHSKTSVSTPLAFTGAQLSISVSGDSATVRGGTRKP